MNTKIMLITLSALVGVSGLASAEMLMPGNYMATVVPAINARTAAGITQQLDQLSALRSVKVKPSDSTVHFTVKRKENLDLARVQDAVSSAAPGHLVLNPAAQPVSADQSDSLRGAGMATGW